MRVMIWVDAEGIMGTSVGGALPLVIGSLVILRRGGQSNDPLVVCSSR